ncbi:Rab GTPase interacting factor, Golgi membrane protein [Trachipleistophora hominis]|uniref:Rab GTPase interacting factor, Golgi membrane protein n=1 Tax=Trachipleistophora hominis TaxID=72359 RepID=L7JZE1_TRAHO|nr:Rab GTPase interacting factor, Golgi membrane protein [Trachipleistophora hominis]
MDVRPTIDLKSAFTGYEPGDPPLLQELGIRFTTIHQECALIFHTPTKSANIDKVDLTGPLLLIFLFSSILLLTGKVLFGYVYFMCVLCTFVAHFVLNAMGENEIEYVVVCSVMGYAMLPVVCFAVVHVLMCYLDVNVRVSLVCGGIGAFYSAMVASEVFVAYLRLKSVRVLVIYPMFLVYMSFVVLALY